MDPLNAVARSLLFASLFSSSFLIARFGELTLGDAALASTIAVASFVVLATEGASRGVIPLGATLVFVFIVVGGLLSCYRAESVGSSVAVIVRLLLVIIVLPWTCSIVLRTGTDLRKALLAFSLGASLCGAATILQFTFGAGVIPGSVITEAGRFAGLTQGVSDTGGVCCGGVAASVGLAATSSSLVHRVLHVVLLIGSAFGLFLSGSVSGMISALSAVLFLAIVGVLRLRDLIPLVGLFVGVLVLVASIQSQAEALTPLARILQTTGLGPDDRYNTAGSRLSTYGAAVDGIMRSPLVGSGLDPSSTIADGEFPAHNILVGAAFDGGVLLLGGILGAIIRPFIGIRRVVVRSDSFSAVLTAVCLCELVFAMTAPSLFNRYLWIPMALLLTYHRLDRSGARSAVTWVGRLSPALRDQGVLR